MKIVVYPKMPDAVRKGLAKGSPYPKEVGQYLFNAVGRKIEMQGKVIGTIAFTEVVVSTLPGETHPRPRVRAIVHVPYDMEEFVRRFLPGGDSPVKPEDEVTSVVGDPAPAP